MNFMTVEQFQFIKKQAKKVLNTYITTKDQQVIQAMQAVVTEDINNKLGDISIDQQHLLHPILDIKSKEQMEQLISDIKPFVEPFKKPTENEIKKLFPKDKKIKVPSLDQLDWQEISFLSWVDSGTNRKYIVYREDGVLKGVRGVFSHTEKKGICSICNQHAKVGMLMVSKSGTSLGTYTKKGNYICEDSQSCNESLTEIDKFIGFVQNLS